MSLAGGPEGKCKCEEHFERRSHLVGMVLAAASQYADTGRGDSGPGGENMEIGQGGGGRKG